MNDWAVSRFAVYEQPDENSAREIASVQAFGFWLTTGSTSYSLEIINPLCRIVKLLLDQW